MDFQTLLATYAGLAGVGAGIGLLVNIGKTAGVVKDGQAPTVATGLNILGLAALFALGAFAPATDVVEIDAQVGQAVQAGQILLGLVVQLLGSRGAHEAARGAAVVGKSYSG